MMKTISKIKASLSKYWLVVIYPIILFGLVNMHMFSTFIAITRKSLKSDSDNFFDFFILRLFKIIYMLFYWCFYVVFIYVILKIIWDFSFILFLILGVQIPLSIGYILISMIKKS